uniref:uncharacterized protein LOC122591725 n=1 Tax=Erigeron canadensis TaxID=72917 RepID=UPI001CB8E682|nr:uncharacterized protein LOC122591725 [Erigeron canadensis]
MESVFRISGCADGDKVKYATCTLLNSALTWWNAYVQPIGIDAAYALPWEGLKEMMRNEYCPRSEVQKQEIEFWHHTVKGTDIMSYTTRFNELVTLCPGMVTPEYKKIERYIWGLPPSIQGNVTSSKPTTIQETIRLSHDLMDQVIRHTAKNADQRTNDNKRKWEDNQRRSVGQLLFKKPNSVRIFNAGPSTNQSYAGNQPLCNKCGRHHQGFCKVCGKCQKTGHLTKDCRDVIPSTKVIQPGGCYNCGDKGHFKQNCPKLMNVNIG